MSRTDRAYKCSKLLHRFKNQLPVNSMKIGNKDLIAFDIDDVSSSKEMCKLTFFLGGKLMTDESIYLPTYKTSFQRFKAGLEALRYQCSISENLSTRQIFHSLQNYSINDDTRHTKHMLQIDESLDQYIVYVIQVHDATRLIWSCWDGHNCNKDHAINEVYTIKLHTVYLVSVIDVLLDLLNKNHQK